MIVRKESFSQARTLADILRRLGDISLDRIRAHPAPGTATLADAIEAKRCELIDGILVEKAMGYRESILAAYLIATITTFVRTRNLGVVTGEQGTMEIYPEHVRIPDVGYASWDRFPGRKLPRDPIPELAPDLAIEVISAGNTRAEMKRKRRDYFRAGVRLVWEIDPEPRTATVYRSATKKMVLTESQFLDGEDILPGLEISLADLFAELDRHG